MIIVCGVVAGCLILPKVDEESTLFMHSNVNELCNYTMNMMYCNVCC